MAITGVKRLTTDRPLRLTALAGNGVGRHSLLLEVGSLRILVDPGSYRNGAVRNVKADQILLTHAHADHVGSLIEVMKNNPFAKVYATPPTKEIVGQVLRANNGQRGQTIDECLARIREVDYDREINLGQNVYTKFIPAGHILGSASIVITSPEGNFLVTGDFATQNRGVLAPFQLPDVDLRALITEGSLVGIGELPSAEMEKQRFLAILNRSVEAGSPIVVATEPYGIFNEYALALPLLQRQAAAHRYQIFINQWVRNGFATYLRHLNYTELRIEGDQAEYEAAYLVLEPLGDQANFRDMGPFFYFAGPGSLCKEFPRRIVSQILEAGGHLIVDGRASRASIERRLRNRQTKVDLLANTSFFNVSNHISGADLRSLILQIDRPTYLMHGSASKLKNFAAESAFKGSVSVLGRGEQFVL